MKLVNQNYDAAKMHFRVVTFFIMEVIISAVACSGSTVPVPVPTPVDVEERVFNPTPVHQVNHNHHVSGSHVKNPFKTTRSLRNGFTTSPGDVDDDFDSTSYPIVHQKTANHHTTAGTLDDEDDFTSSPIVHKKTANRHTTADTLDDEYDSTSYPIVHQKTANHHTTAGTLDDEDDFTSSPIVHKKTPNHRTTAGTLDDEDDFTSSPIVHKKTANRHTTAGTLDDEDDFTSSPIVHKKTANRHTTARKHGSTAHHFTTSPIADKITTNDYTTAGRSGVPENGFTTSPFVDKKTTNDYTTEQTRGGLESQRRPMQDPNEPHPCLRICALGAPPMTCYYDFEVEDYFALSKACYNCPTNRTDCFRPDCIPADGYQRSIMVVNKQMPGPSIDVCHGDRIIVSVLNHLIEQSLTIHWHGIHQTGTPYMDGVPFVTQCPLDPLSSLRYDFTADPAGTHFWHSHMGVQRANGIFGALIVRMPTKLDPNSHLFDKDLSDHTIQILDWDHVSSSDKFLAHYHGGGDNKPATLLVNGKGRNFEISPLKADKRMQVPVARFKVKQGTRYRFRLINAGFFNCPIQLSVDNHNLTIIGSDSSILQPVEAESLVSFAGERFDFIISATQPVNNYWIRLRGLMDCDNRFKSAHQVAVLHYDGASDRDPTGDVSYEAANRRGLQVNAVNAKLEDSESLAIPELTAAVIDDARLKPVADVTFYVSYDFYKLDNPLYNKHLLYGYNQVLRENERSLTPQLNHISMRLPPSPPMSQMADLDPNTFCNGSSVSRKCKFEYCECTHLIRVPLGAVVELFIIDEGATPMANHPFHLHGADFRVIAMDRIGFNTTVETMKALDESGGIERKLVQAPIKDVVTIPHGGYTIVRFQASNPGIWMFHCHIDFHSEIGMALVFQFGEPEDFPPVPKDFPRCGHYSFDAVVNKQRKMG